MLHRLCGPPSIPLSFSLATVLPRRGTYCVSSGTELVTNPTPSAHRLRRGLPGYLIPFATHALAPQRQSVQDAAFATDVLPDLYAFHRSTRNSASPSGTLAYQSATPFLG